MPETLATLQAVISADTGPLLAAIKGAKSEMSGFGGFLQSIGGAMTLGLTLPIVAGFAKAIDSASKFQNATTQLDSALRSTTRAQNGATDAGGRWVNSTDLSNKEVAKLEKQIKSTSSSLDTQIQKVQMIGKETK